MPLQKIVLIDDDAEDQEIFKSALKKVTDQSECITFTDARIALDQLRRGELEPDVIFLDLHMPIMTGHEFLREVKKSEDTRQIPVIIFSTSSHLATIELMKEMGAAGFITKPDRFDKLVSILTPIVI